MEKQITNLQHYFEKWFLTDGKEITLHFINKELAIDFFDKFDVRKWSINTLLEPYDSKKRYQMSRLCYEIIDKWVKENCDNEHNKTARFEDTSLYYILDLLFKDDEANIGRWRDQNVTVQELRDGAEIVI